MANFFPSTAKNMACFPAGGASISFIIEKEVEIEKLENPFPTDLDAFRFFQSKQRFNYDTESDDHFE